MEKRHLLLWSQLSAVHSLGPPCGSGIFAHSSCDNFDPTGWDLAWSPRSREIISGLVCLPFSNNCSHSWFLHTKLLTYCRFSLPSLVQVYNFVSGVLWQLFGLGHSGVWIVTVWGCGQVSFILITSSQQMTLIQVTSGGQRSLLKKKLQVCESQQSCLFVGDQILISHHNLLINSLKILQCDFFGFFFLILSLIVEVYLWWKLQASLIFLIGRTCTIGGWLNTFLPHCMYSIYTKLSVNE